MSREYTSKLLDMMDDGLIDPETLAEQLVGWMSEADVKDFMDSYGYNDDEDEDTDEDEDLEDEDFDEDE